MFENKCSFIIVFSVFNYGRSYLKFFFFITILINVSSVFNVKPILYFTTRGYSYTLLLVVRKVSTFFKIKIRYTF